MIKKFKKILANQLNNWLSDYLPSNSVALIRVVRVNEQVLKDDKLLNYEINRELTSFMLHDIKEHIDIEVFYANSDDEMSDIVSIKLQLTVNK